MDTHNSDSEKALEEKREKRRVKRIEIRQNQKVCYNCRKSGHSMAECTEVKDVAKQSSGICFKCGSNQHVVGKCQSNVPDGVFPFAKCFICDQMGHLSRNCPDNPRGLYPNGGCCKLCGSVKHLRRDCTEHKKKNAVDYSLPILDPTASVDEEPPLKLLKSDKSDNSLQSERKKPKVVKF